MYRFEKTTVKRGDIYWIKPSPYRNNGEHNIQKERPAIIVSNDTINARRYTYEVIYLTTTPRYEHPENCTIRSSAIISTALCGQISTASSEQIGKYIGTCSKAEMETLDACMTISLGINEAIQTGQWSPVKTAETAGPVVTTTAYTMIDPEEEEEYSEEDQDYIEELEANVRHLNEENVRLRIALEKAGHGEEIIRSLYNELLARAFDRSEKVL